MKMITRTLQRLIPCLFLMLSYSLVNAQYCVPSYIAYGTADGDFLDGVEIGTISNVNSGSTGGPSYNDYSGGYSTQLQSGGTYTMTLYNNPDYDEDVAVWIDYNQDNTFDVSEYVGDVSLIAAGSDVINVIVQWRGNYCIYHKDACTFSV